MPVSQRALVCSKFVRPANKLSIRKPAAIRALSSTRRQYVGGYDTARRSNKNESSGKLRKDPSSQSVGWRFTGEAEIGSNSKTGNMDKNIKHSVSETQKSAEETKIDENERVYQAEVEQHNKDFAEGYDRAADHATEMKVDEKFWKGKYR